MKDKCLWWRTTVEGFRINHPVSCESNCYMVHLSFEIICSCFHRPSMTSCQLSETINILFRENADKTMGNYSNTEETFLGNVPPKTLQHGGNKRIENANSIFRYAMPHRLRCLGKSLICLRTWSRVCLYHGACLASYAAIIAQVYNPQGGKHKAVLIWRRWKAASAFESFPLSRSCLGRYGISMS